MKKLPNMLSTKDSSYINDIFNWNITAKRKIDLYINECSDKEVTQELKALSSMHQKNCEELIKFLKGWTENER